MILIFLFFLTGIWNNTDDKFRLLLPAQLYLDDTLKKFNLLFIIDKNILQVILVTQTKFICTT